MFRNVLLQNYLLSLHNGSFEKSFVIAQDKLGHQKDILDSLKLEYQVTSDLENSNTQPIFPKATTKKPQQKVL